MLVILQGSFEEVTPLLMLLFALLNELGTPGNTMASGTVLEHVLVSLSTDGTHPGVVTQIHLPLLAGSSQLMRQSINKSVTCQLFTNMLYSKLLC